ncbi:MAG: diaminopimelate epimerase [Pyrinomonadaceae bacterium]|nr:diaminopimelate epimerase [Pyrinomonadaceae bacterium]
MAAVNFCKFHGFGNDYIIFEAADLKNISLSDFAVKVCHRHTGIGGDGIAVLRKLETAEADYYCEIVNPDGSVAGFSGNGTRCAVAYLYYKNRWTAENLRLETRSGVKNYQLLTRDGNTFWFRAELGKPNFDLPPTPLSKAVLSEPDKTPDTQRLSLLLPEEEIIIGFTFVDVGNPVAVIFLKDFDELDWRQIGSKIENSTFIFPERTNVVFVKIVNESNIEIRIWERGAGETASSGTCSIAAAVASAFTKKTAREISVHAEGGTTETVWRGDDEMLITGRADLTFCGQWI